jgi:small-conductance mechanosensitive channel
MLFPFLPEPWASYLQVLWGVVMGCLAVKIVQAIVLRRLRRWAKRTQRRLDDRFLETLEHLLVPLGYLAVFHVNLQSVDLQGLKLALNLRSALNILTMTIGTILIIQTLSAVIEYGLRLYWSRNLPDETGQASVQILIPSIRVLFWLLGIVFLLDNLGFNLSAVVTGLGIGGVAIALASRGVLEDLFSYFAILFDRPFELGDLVAFETFRGRVEHIGIKTTRLRSQGGEQLVLSNSTIVSAKLQNLDRMEERRVVQRLTLLPTTTAQQLATVADHLQAIVAVVPSNRFESATLLQLSDLGFVFELIYHIQGNELVEAARIQHQVNLKMVAEFEEVGLEFAFNPR